ncbi:MAG: 50S ribosomal protein L31 [Candidatus Shikimatogenerans bostrichidophilus]|nr:MAG: 50S ribosomal protein L31 [Candidatus Shikimatogenerans bostrichidophilus]
MKIKNNYRLVIFKDINNNKFFITRSTIKTKYKIKYKNKIYPFYNIDISKYSHRFYIDNIKDNKITGRVEKFYKKYNL